MFCDNHKCKYNKCKLQLNDNRMFIREQIGQPVKEVHTHLYKNERITLHLCEICHEAVQTVERIN